MTERDTIHVIIDKLESGNESWGIELQRIYDNLISSCAKMDKQLSDGRDYLMQVEPDEINVEDSLESFGFGRNGLTR